MNRHFVIAALAASILAAPASAGSSSHRVVVRHSDLDLTTVQGVARLNQRIAHAADEACGVISTTDLVGMNRRGQCLRAAAETARPRRDAIVDQSRRQSASVR